MICLKVPEVGARLAGGACAAAAVESASTITTNIASLVFIAVPRSGQPGELRVDQLVQRDVLRREILQPAARLLVASCLYLPEDVNVLGEGGGILQRDRIDRLASAHVLHADGGDDRLQLLGADGV